MGVSAMTVGDWVADQRENIREEGITTGLQRAARDAWPGIWRRLGRLGNYGETYWERDWDVLVLLDSCRHDVMQEASADRAWLPDTVPSVYSAASMSEEWIERHTDSRHSEAMAETTLISANPHTRVDCVRERDWHTVDEVWRHSWDDGVDTVPPRGVTDAAIREARTGDSDRLIIWYMQPHQPFVGAEWSKGYEKETFGEGGNHGQDVWRQCRNGEVSREELWEAYRRTLNWVLDDVELLTENIDGHVAITADHGNALGEWGLYGHPKYVPAPAIKRVPWIALDATDSETYTPAAEPDSTGDAEVVESRLADLGYV